MGQERSARIIPLTLLGGAAALLALILVQISPVLGQDATPPAEVVGTPLLEPAIGLTEAQEIALDGQEGAAVRAVELEGEDGVLMWEVELTNGVEVELDAMSGDVLETEQGDDDDDNGDDDDE